MQQQPDASPRLRVVVLGASGMLGSTLLRELRGRPGLSVRGTVRDVGRCLDAFVQELGDILVSGVDVMDEASRADAIDDADVVVNAVGVIKQATALQDRPGAVQLNALLPQQLAAECAARGSRLVHVSTDCVFSGRRGGYTEADTPDPVDFYGRSKLLGEVEAPALTLRTSIIGHETQRHASLVDWFLSQPSTSVRGYSRAVYSGVTTHEFARLLADIVLRRPDLVGLYHVASEPIVKSELLALVAERYGWTGQIEDHPDFQLDRSMRADRLAEVTGYRPPSWAQMIDEMHEHRPSWSVRPAPAVPPA